VKDKIYEHMLSRGFIPGTPGVYWSEEDETVDFLLWNPHGFLIGYQRYRPGADKKAVGREARYFTRKTHVNSCSLPTVWGLHTFLPSTKRLFIVEGIWDAISLHRAGESAIAVLSSGASQSVHEWLSLLPVERIAILDNDGKSGGLRRLAHRHFVVPDPYKDLNEMRSDDIVNFLKCI